MCIFSSAFVSSSAFILQSNRVSVFYEVLIFVFVSNDPEINDMLNKWPLCASVRSSEKEGQNRSLLPGTFIFFTTQDV